MAQFETTPQRKISSHPMSIDMVGLFLFAACLPILLMLVSLLGYGLVISRLRYSLLAFYLPQVGVIAFAIIFVVRVTVAIRRHKLGEWKTYIPLIMLAIYCLVVMAASLSVVAFSIYTKIDNVENRQWSEAMVSRALGKYPTGVSCVLSNQVVALVGEWSFVTPDGHMPVLTWSESSVPNSDLLGHPVSCMLLQPNWYLCYLSKPYELTIDKNACD